MKNLPTLQYAVNKVANWTIKWQIKTNATKKCFIETSSLEIVSLVKCVCKYTYQLNKPHFLHTKCCLKSFPFHSVTFTSKSTYENNVLMIINDEEVPRFVTAMIRSLQCGSFDICRHVWVRKPTDIEEARIFYPTLPTLCHCVPVTFNL